jgi:hypothetical protein
MFVKLRLQSLQNVLLDMEAVKDESGVEETGKDGDVEREGIEKEDELLKSQSFGSLLTLRLGDIYLNISEKLCPGEVDMLARSAIAESRSVSFDVVDHNFASGTNATVASIPSSTWSVRGMRVCSTIEVNLLKPTLGRFRSHEKSLGGCMWHSR